MANYVVREYDSLPCDDDGGVFGWFNHYKGPNMFEAMKVYLYEVERAYSPSDIEFKKDYGKPGTGKGGKHIKKFLRRQRMNPVKIHQPRFVAVETDELPF